MAEAVGQVGITLPGGLDRVVAAPEVGVGWAAVGDLACGSGFLAAGGADATGGDLALAEGWVGMARAGEIGLCDDRHDCGVVDRWATRA